jgi:hypothetical protein
MNGLRTIFRELFGLFVDDGSLALQILVWLGLTVLLLPYLGWLSAWLSPYLSKSRGVILFLGLAAILMASAIRYARRNRS